MAEKDKLTDEELTDKELEQVAGGLWDRHQLADDSRFLIADAWASVGIEIKEGSLFGGHSYNLNGKEISQAQAWAHA